MAKSTKKKKNSPEKKYPLPYLIPLIAILAIIPVIVYMYTYDTGLTQYDWYQGPEQTVDFFLHAKMVWLLITLAALLFFLAYMIFSAEITPVWTKTLVPFVIYCVLTFISALFSINRNYSFSGIHEQFEPVWILMGYGLILYYAFYNLRSEEAVKRLMRWFVAGIVIMCVIGLSQAFSHDIFRENFMKYFILPESARNIKLTFNFENGRTYLSLYNPNYVGYYVALVVPILIALLFHTKKILYRIGYGILILTLLFILFASQSRAGIIAIAFSFVLMLLCMRKVFFKHWMVTSVAIVAVVVAFIGINIMNHGILIDRMKSMFSTASENHPLESIITKDDVTITYNKNKIHFNIDWDEENNYTFSVTDENGKDIAYTTATSTEPYMITDQRFPFSFSAVESEENSFKGFQVTIDDKTWYFTNSAKTGDSSYYVKGLGNALFKLKTHEKSVQFLEEHYHFANMRGYIWARTLPLLKKYFFLGSGPDTFVIAFPNDDLVGLYNSGHDGETITRPHCMYLQIAVQTGVPSLLAFLIFFGWYIIDSLKLYWKQDYSALLPKVGIGVLASVIGYLILALTNDSCIAVAPVFFALAGMGLGINYHLKTEV